MASDPEVWDTARGPDGQYRRGPDRAVRQIRQLQHLPDEPAGRIVDSHVGGSQAVIRPGRHHSRRLSEVSAHSQTSSESPRLLLLLFHNLVGSQMSAFLLDRGLPA
jgi:hypothetical protein